ncbi:hypothetical protein COL5a_004048 [Colletotrichum fioriniae]|nr:uncharacterized protein COL516b_000125 [Colletotrichum fioriniae]KAJ0313196.1 hypothetical protein COL516b_000125 [Colletotrichum fioriniae]KAJ0329488.1 hypothetical protein COL5a_004048 [Colletotrichum fioriniae]
MASATENSSDVLENSDEPKTNGPERAESPSVTEKISFDDRGDLTLRVGSLEDGFGDVFEFVVCSRALARASPVLRAMLFGGFSESKPDGDIWIVKLPEDRTAPFFILLNIIHGRFRAVPQKLKLDELYQLLVVTNKSEMLSVIFQWAPIWFEPHKNLDEVLEGNERLLWIAWELGEERTFELKCRDFVLRSNVNTEGQIVDKRGAPLNTYDYKIMDRFEVSRRDFKSPISDNNLNYMRNQAKKTAIGGDRSAEAEEPQKKKPRF